MEVINFTDLINLSRFLQLTLNDTCISKYTNILHSNHSVLLDSIHFSIHVYAKSLNNQSTEGTERV